MKMVQQQHTDQFLLATKLAIPHIHAGLVTRPRLFEQLQTGMQRPLTLLAAPAGFGKTMLLSAWIQQSKRSVGWVSLDSNDNDPTQFWAYVITALDKLHPGIGKTPLSLLQSAQSAPIETVLIALVNGDATRTIALAHEALSLLPENDLYNRSSCLVAIGASYLLLGQLSEAQQYLTEGRALNPAPVNLITVLLATNLLGDLQVVRGNLHEAVAIYQDVLRQADERPIWQVAEAHIGLGNIFREWNKLEDGVQSLRQALALAQQTWREVYLAPGYIVLAHILEARGQLAQAHENLVKAVEVAQRLGHLPALRRAKAQQARLNLAQGNLMLAEQWSEAAGIRGDEELDYEHEVEYLVLARLRIAQNRADDALRLLSRLLTADEAAGRRGHVIQNLAIQVIAYQSLGKTEQAMRTLERVLALAEPEDYVRVFVDEGVPMREVVTKFLALSTQPSRTLGKSVSRDYVQKLLAAFPQTETEHTVAQVGARATEQSSAAASLIEPLSIREQEVLELLAAGMSNQEIARHLVVTEGTIKTHIKSIYGKLGVHSRTQAVARARELSLL